MVTRSGDRCRPSLPAGVHKYAVLAGIAAVAAGVFSSAKEPKVKSAVQKKTLWVISSPQTDEPLEVAVGDVLQFMPFQVPVNPRFLDARIQPKLTGDITLEPIGEATVEQNEGRTGRSYFFLVRDKGRSSVTLELLNDKKEPMGGYRAEYQVKSLEKPAG
jgi:hypothetical protein